MSMSLTGRHRDWLSLTPSSIRPNGSQARHGAKAGALRGEADAGTDRMEVLCLDPFAVFRHVEHSWPDRKTFKGPTRHKAVHFPDISRLISHLRFFFCQRNSSSYRVTVTRGLGFGGLKFSFILDSFSPFELTYTQHFPNIPDQPAQLVACRFALSTVAIHGVHSWLT